MQEDLGKLVLRLTTGGLLLLHGMHKLLNGIDQVSSMVVAHNIPDVFAYGVYLGEIVGPILVILGLYARIGGALIMANMLVAILLAGAGSLLSLNSAGGYALEVETFFLATALAITLLGAGRFSLGGGRWN